MFTEKYERQLVVVMDSIERLKSVLADARQKAVDLQQLVDEVAREKKQILEEQKQRESGFVRQVAEKNTIISGLRTDITSLQTELQNRDEIIEDNETSFGRILAQSVKLSTKCIMNTMQYLGLYSN